jgi:hypothetical protein
MLSQKKTPDEVNYLNDLSKSFSQMYDGINDGVNDGFSNRINNPPILGNIRNTFNDTFQMQDQMQDQMQNQMPNQMMSLQLESPPILQPNPQLDQILPQGTKALDELVSNKLPTASGSGSGSGSPSALSSLSGIFSTASSGSNEASASSNLLSSSQSSMLETIITTFLLFIFLILIAIYAMQYFYNFDIIAKIKNIFTNHPEVEIKVEKNEEPDSPEKKDAVDNDILQIMKKPQVFNIADNNYIYGDAKAVCKAYGARLATYQEVEEAYDKGAEWCNYGWSDGQMALFPTQQKTWDGLQKIEGHENDCGRPGINGGFIDNPKIKYGVNCYGYKPKINKLEKELMETSSVYPKSKKDLAMDERVEYWKDRLSEILVSPFNHDKWSKA